MTTSSLRLTEADHQRLAKRFRMRRHLVAYGFLAPSFFFLVFVLLIPSLWVVYLSFHRGGILDEAVFVGFANWEAIFSDSVAWQAARNTLVYAALVTPISFVSALGLAMLIRRLSVGRSALRAMVYFPTLTPYVVAALMWTFVVHPQFGVLNVITGAVGVTGVNWLGPDLSLLSVVLLEFWHGLGYWTIIFLAALIGLPTELYQAAEVDGAGSWARFRHITLPLLRPTFLFAVVIATILNIQVFDPVMVLTDGGPAHSSETAAVYLYKQTFQFFRPGVGAAMSVLMLAVILVLTVVQLRLLRKRW